MTQQRGVGVASQYVAVMQQGRVVALDAPLALLAATLGARHMLPLAVSIIYTTAQQSIGLVWFGLVWFGLVWFGLVWFGRRMLTLKAWKVLGTLRKGRKARITNPSEELTYVEEASDYGAVATSSPLNNS